MSQVAFAENFGEENIMKIKDIPTEGYERVVEATLTSGQTAIISIHNTNLGPALGGLRFYDYASHEDALFDVLRLSKGMTYKSALARLPLGGGKSVIIGNPDKAKTPELLESFGEFLNELQGRYITAKDVGIEVEDLDVISTKTNFVRGTSNPNSAGDPSPLTAYGVYHGILSAAKAKWGTDDLTGKKVIVQGMGHVGFDVAKRLKAVGAELLITEYHEDRLKACADELGATPLALDGWLNTKADLYCPCALGATVNPDSIPRLHNNGIEIIAGGANNQLLDTKRDGAKLRELGILYAPDFVINAGGIICIACELDGVYDEKLAYEKADHIHDTLLEVFDRSLKFDQPTAVAATEMAKELVEKAKR
jgi:leucine dehydrogenase